MMFMTSKCCFIFFLFSVALFSSGCKDDNGPIINPRNFEDVIKVDGLNRTFIVNLPPQYENDNSNFPLVIGLHGIGGNAMQFEKDYFFSRMADDAGFIAVYPNGVQSNGKLGIRTWNAGTCCDYAMKENIDDVKFISGLIDKLVTDYRVDPKRVYVTGMSNGGMMAYRLASEIPNRVAAIAAVSGTMVFNAPATQIRSIPILHLHSLIDKIVPYDGGRNALGYYFPPIDSVLTVWSERNRCQSDIQIIDKPEYKLSIWKNEFDVPVIVHYATKDGGHSWPGGNKVRPGADPPSKAIDANILIWDFFKKHTLP